MTMAYILFLNPSILSATGMDTNAVFFATAISAGFVTTSVRKIKLSAHVAVLKALNFIQ
jgi:xanthine/uracil/vitamin C permease (AzgA family)